MVIKSMLNDAMNGYIMGMNAVSVVQFLTYITHKSRGAWDGCHPCLSIAMYSFAGCALLLHSEKF
jgi:hypothetical protein